MSGFDYEIGQYVRIHTPHSDFEHEILDVKDYREGEIIDRWERVVNGNSYFYKVRTDEPSSLKGQEYREPAVNEEQVVAIIEDAEPCSGGGD